MQTTEDEWGAGVSPLFSTEAPHNAEVMPEEEFRTVDQLWSVEATDDVDQDGAQAVEDEDSHDVSQTATPQMTPEYEDTTPVEETTTQDSVGYYQQYDDDDSAIIEAEIVDDGTSDYTSSYHDHSSDDANGFHDSESTTTESSTSHLFGNGAASEPYVVDDPEESSTQDTSHDAHDPWVVDSGATDWGSADPHLYDSDGTFIGGGVFSSDPVVEDHDVIDYVDDLDDEIEDEPHEEPWIPHHLQDSGSQLFGGLSNPVVEDDDYDSPASSYGAAPSLHGTSGDPWVALEDTEDEEFEAASVPTGSYDDAIERLSIDEQNRVAIPLAVVGSMLETAEYVHGVVGGQMLGQPAVIVVTNSRVLVVNARRWRPIVDEYAVDGSLIVRGRHDKDVAALSFADPEKFSMVDDITDVELAIELADRIRSG